MFKSKEIEEKKKAAKKAGDKLDAALDASEEVAERKKKTSNNLTQVIEESCAQRKASISDHARKAVVEESPMAATSI